MHIVLINGPAGAGKNTLAKEMRPELRTGIRKSKELQGIMRHSTSSISIDEFKQPLINMLFAFAESLSMIELGCDTSDERLYEQLKKTRMLGRTGRAWQIIWADAMRAADSAVFVDGLHEKVKNMALDIALVPDCGFEDEFEHTVNKFGKDNVTLIYLDGWEKDVPIYKHGDRYKDDIRRCLRDWAHLVNPSSLIAAHYVLGRMSENAKQQALDF